MSSTTGVGAGVGPACAPEMLRPAWFKSPACTSVPMLLPPSQLMVALPRGKLIVGMTRRQWTRRLRLAKPCGSSTAISSHSQLRAGRAATAEDAAGQEHAVGGEALLHRRVAVDHVRVVGVEFVEDGVVAVRLVEQALQRAGVDAPSLLRDVARRAAPPVRALGLEIFAGEVDGALRAEGRRRPAGVRRRSVVGDAVGCRRAGRADRPGTQFVCEHAHQSEQSDRSDRRPYPVSETLRTTSLHRNVLLFSSQIGMGLTDCQVKSACRIRGVLDGLRHGAWALCLRMSEVLGRFMPDSLCVRRVGRATRPTAR